MKPVRKLRVAATGLLARLEGLRALGYVESLMRGWQDLPMSRNEVR